MTSWRLSLASDQPRTNRWRTLPRPLMAKVSGPEHYVAHEALIEAVNTALVLGQPLLLTGEPGCGKTGLGDFVAWKLGLQEAIRYQAKTDMQARDLFYTYDTLARFHAANMASRDKTFRIDANRYIHYQGLGLAIIRATPVGKYEDLLPEHFNHSEQLRSVVLIDEVDKAPRDVPNDILNEVEELKFRIPELDNAIIEADQESVQS